MRNFIEKKIRFNVAGLYLLLVTACFCLVLYMFNLHNNIKKQKEEVENHNASLLITNKLILTVNQVQANTAEYLSTKHEENLIKIKTNLATIEETTNALKLFTKSASQDSLLREIGPLLNKKTDIVSKIIVGLNRNNPVESINEKLRDYQQEKEQRKDSLQIDSVALDSVIKIRKPKNLFQTIFSDKKSADTTITIRTYRVDTLKISSADTFSVLSQVGSAVDKASKGYDKNIKEISGQIKNLIITDQKISAQISSLLLELYQETLNTTLTEIEKIRFTIKKHYETSIMIAVSSLLMSLLLVIFIIRNTNKSYAARIALEQANKLNKEIMESRHKLLLSVSHDIKTPLNTILGNIELLQSNKKEFISIQNAGKHILALLNNLLDFSSMEQGKIQISYSNFNLKQLLHEVSEVFYPLASQKEIHFSCNFNVDDAIIVHSDALRIKQIIANLLSNAIKYTPEGEVLFSVDYEQNELHLTVVDSGIGIPAEEQAKIFSPFTRGKNSHLVAEGSGLGLYVLKGLIELLGGKIELESEIEKGTKVKVEIPVEELKLKKGSNTKNILLLDDDLSFLNLIQSMLLKLGHKTSICSEPESFEKKLKELDKYDLILTDLDMDTFSGVDVLKKAKAIEPALPVYAMSGRSNDFGSEYAKTLGFDAFLQKPLTISDLQPLIGGELKQDCDFKTLNELFKDDKETIQKVLDAFVNSTIENIDNLKQTIVNDDFCTAQAICHKMLTMFIQLEAKEAIVILKKMDSLRDQKSASYPEWKEKTEELIRLAKDLIKDIKSS